ncbi:MAG: hypothetical protein E3J86_14600 [Candidatus Thorarchaeota archaeon]|nr:MAG: hypothetical protein E3J86_14600 [Candidatus Thorarchaeota archaeon]
MKLEDLVRILPKSITSFIGRNPNESTFMSFVLESGQGLHPRDRRRSKNFDENDRIVLARVGVARISKWLQCFMLPGQNILIDAPHLVSRFPSLLLSEKKNLSALNGTAQLDSSADLGIEQEKIADYEFQKPDWLSRRTWFWNQISNLDTIKEVKTPWKVKPFKYGFCEDTSRFYSLSKCKEFAAQVESPYITRYVRMKYDTVEYEPRVRLLIPQKEDDIVI